MTDARLNLLRGTLDLLVLKALSWGGRHGYGVSEWIESVTDTTLLVEEGTLYPALHRLEAKGLIEAEWVLSENNRKAKYYQLTKAGWKRLDTESAVWERYAAAVKKALAATGPDPVPVKAGGEVNST